MWTLLLQYEHEDECEALDKHGISDAKQMIVIRY